MPKRTPIESNVEVMNWRTRNVPVLLVDRIRALAFILGTTEEDIVNQCIVLGLDYLEGTNDYMDSQAWDGIAWRRRGD